MRRKAFAWILFPAAGLALTSLPAAAQAPVAVDPGVRRLVEAKLGGTSTTRGR